MNRSWRPPTGADRCFVWLKDESGMLHGVPVDPIGDPCEQAARAWLALGRHPITAALLRSDTVLRVRADDRATNVPFTVLREWLLRQSSSPREATLKGELRMALGLTTAR